MNRVLDEGIDQLPLDEQRMSAKDWRQCGAGIMGFADMLIHMGIRYGSEECIDIINKIGKHMINSALKSSALLSKHYGPYKYYNYEYVSSTDFYKNNVLPGTDELIKKYGLRNSQLLTIAPTGTISTILKISGGMEPIFANYYERKTESLYKEEKIYKVYTDIVKKYMEDNNINDDRYLPEYFVTSQTIDYKERLKVQSTWQKYIDASISSTVNVPNSFSIEDVRDLYILAYNLGLKGVTIFRDGCARVGILTTNSSKKDKESNKQIYDYIQPISRKSMGVTHGDTYCKKCACGTLYITINRDDDNNIVECFVHTSKGGICQANISAVNRMASLNMRAGVKIAEIIDQLKGINCPACSNIKAKGGQVDGLSCPDIISRTLQSAYDKAKNNTKTVKKETINNSSPKCPECGEELQMTGGCRTCSNCGWSKCE